MDGASFFILLWGIWAAVCTAIYATLRARKLAAEERAKAERAAWQEWFDHMREAGYAVPAEFKPALDNTPDWCAGCGATVPTHEMSWRKADMKWRCYHCHKTERIDRDDRWNRAERFLFA